MDKDHLSGLKNDIRRTLQAITDNLLELDDYLTRLRAETMADIEAAMPTGTSLTQDEIDAALGIPRTETDPRRPYQNQRQPRRDGDSFGTVSPSSEFPTQGDTHGTKAAFERQRRRTAREEKT